MTQKHTPTPWKVIKGDWEPWEGAIEISSGNNTIAYTTSGGNEEMDAAHIVKCVNMHDELVAVMSDIHDFLKRSGYDTTMVKETLKKAGAL